MRAIIKTPRECSLDEISLFEKLVLEGGEVQAQGLRKRIEQAYKLIFIELDNQCVAVGALKRPNINYKNKVFLKSGEPDAAKDYLYELGYLYTLSESRGKGIGSFLMKSVINALDGNSCFATTREDNLIMHHLFKKTSFARLGKAYQSNNGNYQLGLFTKKS
ncbi:GNAT family N-acetyltransferase [Aliikangiella coralliicola]|nr:GNAT family N-acetyltransferase [Aliikangiella coralliicola]